MYRLSLPILTFVALCAGSFPVAHAGDDIKAENPLIRPPGAPDPDAKGHVRSEFDPSKNRHRLKVEAEQIDTSLLWECYLADAGGVLQFVGNIPYDDVGEVEIEFDTKEGGLPFGATTVSSLAGRAVEVRSGGLTYLTGTVPSLNGGGGGSGGGGGGSGGGGSDVKVKWFLTRAATSPDTNASGYIELRKKSDGDQKFKVEADHIDPSIAFSVWVETALGSGVLASAGAMLPEDFDEVELELETEDGAALPNGATDVATLAGLRVEVRDATNAVYLEGVVPSITGGGSGGGSGGSGNDKAKASFTGSGGKVELELERKNNSSQEFELEIKKLKIASTVGFFVFSSTQSAFVPVTTLGLNGGGNAKLKIETKKGQPLPLGVTSLSSLGNVAFELRDGTSGVVLIAGTIPQL